MLPWLLALEHLVMMPSEAARQELGDGQPWPGLRAAQIMGSLAVAFALLGAWVLASKRPHLVAGVLVLLALVMDGLVRPLAWKNAPVDVLVFERGKIWVVWLGLSLLGVALATGAAFVVRPPPNRRN